MQSCAAVWAPTRWRGPRTSARTRSCPSSSPLTNSPSIAAAPAAKGRAAEVVGRRRLDLLDRRRLREHLNDPLYRTGYYLIIGTGITSLMGVAFWALAARSYDAHDVGLN